MLANQLQRLGGLAILLTGMFASGCSSGTVQPSTGASDERPSAPRPDEHVPDSGDDATGIAPADSATSDTGDAGEQSPQDSNAPGTGDAGSPNQTQDVPTDQGGGGPADTNSPSNPNVSDNPSPPADANGVSNPNVATEPNIVLDPNGATNANDVVPGAGTPTEPNTTPPPAPPAPPTPLSPREICRRAWLALGQSARYGDPFGMDAAQDENWRVAFRVDGLDVEAQPAQMLLIDTTPGGESGTCQVPVAWSVELLSPTVTYDPFLASYQRLEPIRRQLATGGMALEEKSFSAWQDFSDRELWLAWNLQPSTPTGDQLQAVAATLGAPAEQPASWHNALDTVDDMQAPGLAVAVGIDPDPTHARYWGILTDPVRASGGSPATRKAFFAVATPGLTASFYGAVAMANVWPWDKLVSWDTTTQQGMACDADGNSFERRCDQVLPAYASEVYRATFWQGATLYAHVLWETRKGEEAFLTTVVVHPDGTLAVDKTQRFEQVKDLGLPSLTALHTLENF